MVGLRDDTANVKREFEGLSTSAQVFVWTLVGLGVVIGVLIGGIVGYGISVDEVEGRDCIEHEGVLYCADEEAEPAQ